MSKEMNAIQAHRGKSSKWFMALLLFQCNAFTCVVQHMNRILLCATAKNCYNHFPGQRLKHFFLRFWSNSAPSMAMRSQKWNNGNQIENKSSKPLCRIATFCICLTLPTTAFSLIFCIHMCIHACANTFVLYWKRKMKLLSQVITKWMHKQHVVASMNSYIHIYLHFLQFFHLQLFFHCFPHKWSP